MTKYNLENQKPKAKGNKYTYNLVDNEKRQVLIKLLTQDNLTIKEGSK